MRTHPRLEEWFVVRWDPWMMKGKGDKGQSTYKKVLDPGMPKPNPGIKKDRGWWVASVGKNV